MNQRDDEKNGKTNGGGVSPMMVGMVGAAVGAAAGVILPQRENREKIGQKIEEATDLAKTKGKEMGDKVSQQAHDLSDEAKKKTNEKLDELEDQAKKASDKVKATR